MKRTANGYMYKRNGWYWLQYDKHGVRRRVSLNTKNEVTANEVRARIMESAKSESLDAAIRTLESQLTMLKEQARMEDYTLMLVDVWQQFIDHPQREKCSSNTTTAYKQQWARFVDWCTERDVLDARQLTDRHATQYLSDLDKDKNINVSTWNKHMHCLRMVWGLVLSRDPYGIPNPFVAFKSRRHVPKKHRPLSTGEVQRVLDWLAKNNRDYLTLFRVGANTGLRLVDCVNLRWDQFDEGMQVLTVTPQKTKNTSGATVHIPVMPRLRTYLSSVERRGPFVNPAIKSRYDANRINISKDISSIFRVNKVYDNEAGTVGFHSLRHTFAGICGLAGVPQAVVQQVLGHGSEMMTSYYQSYSQTDAAKLAGAMKEVDRG